MARTRRGLGNAWLLLPAAAVFLAAQLWMSWALWQRTGNAPPEPDDSYAYITGIHLIARYGTPLPALPGLPRSHLLDTGMAHLTYNAAFGLTARVTGCSAACVYHASFYAGKVALLGVLLLFLARVGLRVEERAAALTVLGMYAGDPATHGLYWVVPSFWLLVAFLLIAALALGTWRRRARGAAAGAAAGLLFAALHPLSLWAGLVLGLFTAALRWREGPALWRQRASFLAGAAAGIAAMVAATLLLARLMQVPQPAQSLSAQLAGLTAVPSPVAVPEGGLWERLAPVLPSAWLIWTTFARFLIAQPYLIPLLWGAAVLWRRRAPALPLLWAAAALGVLAAARHPAGARTVLFVWPLTYMLLSVGLLDVMARLRRRFPRLNAPLAAATVVLTLAAAGATLNYALPTVRAVARAQDFTWDPSCAAFLLDTADAHTVIEYSDKYALGAFTAHGLLERRRGDAASYLRGQKEGQATRYLFVESPNGTISRAEVESTLGQPLAPLRECGFFTILAAP